VSTPDQITRDIVIEAPVEVVWRVVTEPEHIVRWFSDAAEIDLRPGGDGVLTFESHRHVAPLVVDTVDPPTTFAFRWSAPEGERPDATNSTLVTFSLAAAGAGRTRLVVTEAGITSLPGGEERHRVFHDDHTEGWSTIVPRLGEYAPTASKAASPR
jgi:uncharacterized protein YndB with AHSA1/START domain